MKVQKKIKVTIGGMEMKHQSFYHKSEVEVRRKCQNQI